MPIRIPCPYCGAPLHAPDAHAGRRGRCGSCRGIVALPALHELPTVDEQLPVRLPAPPPRALSTLPIPPEALAAPIVRSRPSGARRGTSPTVMLWGVAVAVLTVFSAFVVVFLLMRSEPEPSPVPPPEQKEGGVSQPPAHKPRLAPAKTADRTWLLEATQELLASLRADERRAREQATRLGLMNEFEYKLNARALGLVMQHGVRGVPPDLVSRARQVAPETIRALEREELMVSGRYARLVELGEAPPRLPAARRKELFQRFSELTGEKGKWSVSHPFDDLDAEEMQDVVRAVGVARLSGFSALMAKQRRLILKAGGRRYFERELEKAKRGGS